MRWQCCSQIFNTFLLIIIFCSLIQVDGRIRRRRQNRYNNYGNYVANNYGNYALDPAVASYYGTSGGGRYTGNGQDNNRLFVGGVAYQYPTPVNVMSGGSYNPQQYNIYPPGSDGYYYNLNNMRLASPDGWYSGYYFQGYPFLPFYNSAQRHANISIIIKLFSMIFTCLFCINIL